MPNSFRQISVLISLFLLLTLWNSCSSVTERLDDYEVHGIDVSHYQKEVNWDVVAEQDINFAFVKASEGQTYKDSIFAHNWAEMARVGLRRGAYHFYIPSVAPKLQVKNFTEAVQMQPGDLPPVLDFEKVGKKNRIELISDLRTWLTEVEQFYNIKPIIYTNQKLYNRYIRGNFNDHIVWIARYNTAAPEMPFSQSWSFWQYGNRGRINGIEGDVDFNVFHGDVDALESMTYQPRPDVDSITDVGRPFQL